MHVRTLPAELTKPAASPLSEAFLDYPAFLAIGSRRPGLRRALIRRYFLGEMAIARRYGGEVLGAWHAGRPVAAAIVFDPGRHGPPPWALVHRLSFLMFGPGAVARGLRTLVTMSRAHPPEPHVWLDALGVDPACQRTGAGSALVSDVVERSQALEAPAFLHTTRPENPAYYRCFGFEVVHEGDLPRGKRFWSMLRPV